MGEYMENLISDQIDGGLELQKQQYRINQKRFYQNFIIRYFQNSDDTHNSQLIGLPRLKKIINNEQAFKNIIKRVEGCKNDKLRVKLRRGVIFEFIGR